MKIPKSINRIRRKATQGLTKNIGNSAQKQYSPLPAGATIKRILISRPNGRLGNLLLITPLLQEVTATFPDCTIDVFVKGGLAPILFKNYKNVNFVIQLPGKPFKDLFKYIGKWVSIKKHRYDIAINVVKHSSSGRLSVQFANAKYKFFGDDATDAVISHPDYGHMAKYAVYNFRHYISQLGFPETDRPVPLLDLKLSTDELANGKRVLQNIVKNDKETICIFTYATGAKCFPPEWWEPVYQRMLAEYPGYNIIELLPKENVSQIGFKAPTFYSMDIREMGAVLAHTKVFLGADSGVMHLASASQTPTVGLFSGNNQKVYEPYNPGSIAINTNENSIDDIINTINAILNVR